MSPTPVDLKLYEKIKKEAEQKFISKTGIYKSSWIVREYVKRGGTYIENKPKMTGLKRWYKEKWVDLNRPIKNNKEEIIGYEDCGRNSQINGKYPLCRPINKVNSKTPLTVKEIDKTNLKNMLKNKQKYKDKINIKFKKIEKK